MKDPGFALILGCVTQWLGAVWYCSCLTYYFWGAVVLPGNVPIERGRDVTAPGFILNPGCCGAAQL